MSAIVRKLLGCIVDCVEPRTSYRSGPFVCIEKRDYSSSPYNPFVSPGLSSASRTPTPRVHPRTYSIASTTERPTTPTPLTPPPTPSRPTRRPGRRGPDTDITPTSSSPSSSPRCSSIEINVESAHPIKTIESPLVYATNVGQREIQKREGIFERLDKIIRDQKSWEETDVDAELSKSYPIDVDVELETTYV